MRLLFAFAALLSLTACASISKDECLAGNWEEIGFGDGTNGQFSSYIQKHAKACQKVQVTPDPVAWEKGRQRGLPAYCVPQKAYEVGRTGWDVRDVCPADKMPALRAANAKGKRYYELTQDIDEARGIISENEQRLISEENADMRAALVGQSRSLNLEIRLLELQRRQFDSL